MLDGGIRGVGEEVWVEDVIVGKVVLDVVCGVLVEMY